MADKPEPKDIPGNHGQFGRNIATEEYKPLDNHEEQGRTSPPASAPPGKDGPGAEG